jgi:hypothetical protein
VPAGDAFVRERNLGGRIPADDHFVAREEEPDPLHLSPDDDEAGVLFLGLADLVGERLGVAFDFERRLEPVDILVIACGKFRKGTMLRCLSRSVARAKFVHRADSMRDGAMRSLHVRQCRHLTMYTQSVPLRTLDYPQAGSCRYRRGRDARDANSLRIGNGYCGSGRGGEARSHSS